MILSFLFCFLKYCSLYLIWPFVYWWLNGIRYWFNFLVFIIFALHSLSLVFLSQTKPFCIFCCALLALTTLPVSNQSPFWLIYNMFVHGLGVPVIQKWDRLYFLHYISTFIIFGRNYAPTIYVQNEAIKKGCQQVLWLFGNDHLISEVGTMNIFIYWITKSGSN